MARDAHDTIARFWEIQNSGDYTATVGLFAEDAVFDDPIYGTFNGRAEIGPFMEKMNSAVAARGGRFVLVRLSGDDHTAWAQWEFHTDDGLQEGCGVYEVENGQITYYRDYMNAGR